MLKQQVGRSQDRLLLKLNAVRTKHQRAITRALYRRFTIGLHLCSVVLEADLRRFQVF
jgi:hypothetical protein